MLTALLPAALLAASQLMPMDTATAQPGERLSSAEIGAVLGSSNSLPPNCEVLGDPCIGIRCGPPQNTGDWPSGFYSCDGL